MYGRIHFTVCLAFITGWILFGSLSAADVPSTSPIHETRAVFEDEADNLSDADDPAIWVNSADPRRSLVIGTLKRGGLDVYDLKGALLQHVTADVTPPDMQLGSARYNNVDIVYRLRVGNGDTDLAVVTDRHNDVLRFFAIDPDAIEEGRSPLTEITAPGVPRVFSADVDELKTGKTAYGLAVTQIEPNHEAAHAFVSRSGQSTVAKARIFSFNGRVSYSVVAEFNLPDHFPLPDGTVWTPCQDQDGDTPQVEGMAMDDFHGVLYLAQERVGIWKIRIDQPSPQPALLDRVKAFGVPSERTLRPDKKKYLCQPKWKESPGLGSDYLSPDVEGLTIYDAGRGQGYLLASSQGTNEFVIYDRVAGAYIGKFAIGDGIVDGSEQCDGAHVVSANLGGELSSGLLVVQDGEDSPKRLDEKGMLRESTNFKFVRWVDVARCLGLTVRKQL